jgi:hypothetical protein
MMVGRILGSVEPPQAAIEEEASMSHTYANILVHVIFSTKDRKPLTAARRQSRLYAYMAGVAREEFGEAVVVGVQPTTCTGCCV